MVNFTKEHNEVICKFLDYEAAGQKMWFDMNEKSTNKEGMAYHAWHYNQLVDLRDKIAADYLNNEQNREAWQTYSAAKDKIYIKGVTYK